MTNISKSSPQKSPLRLFLTGFAMGTADLIPGVSGGTVAFLTGIYEELLESIKTVTGKVIKLALDGELGNAILAIPFSFLLPLGIGIFAAILTLAKFLTYLLSEYPVYIWSFFFGLVLASVLVVSKRVKTWDAQDILVFVAATIGAYYLVGSIPVETPVTPIYFFFSGVLAICAMILPGISGSFILLLLGKYTQILEAVTNRQIGTLVLVMAGCVVGLALFSRFLTWLFAHHHDISVAALSGFMLGSARKIWPWKEVVLTRINSHGAVVPLVEKNMLPSGSQSSLFFAVLLMILAFGFVLLLEFKQLAKDKHA